MTDTKGDDLTIEDYKAAIADTNRLVRELDVAMHGEDSAALQASLCELIPLAKKMKECLDDFDKFERIDEAIRQEQSRMLFGARRYRPLAELIE